MKKFNVLILDRYLDLAIREIGEFGYAQIIGTDTEKFKLEEGPDVELYDRILLVLGRINNIINILGINREKSLKPISLGVEDKNPEEILEYVENEIEKIENKVLEKYSRPNELTAEEENLKADEYILRILKINNIKPQYLNESEFLYTVAGFMSKKYLNELKNKLEEKFNRKFAIITGDELDGNTLFVILCMKYNSNDLDKILAGIRFERLELKTKLSLKEIEKRLDKIRKEKHEIISYLDNIRSEYEQRILAMRELIEIEKNNQNIRFMLGKTKRVYVLEGWIPEEKIPEFESRVERIAKGNVLFKYYDPEDAESVPIIMKNPAFSKPFEPLTKAFGIPRYDEIDPTTVMAISFPIIYGLMFGDIGHGFMILLIGIVMLKFLSKGNDGIKSLGIILMYCGILSMFFGLAYGDLFGSHELFHEYVTESLGIKRLWISPVEESQEFLIVAFIVGFIHMTIGITLRFINYTMNGKFFHAIAGPFIQQWLFTGGVLLIVKKGPNFMSWFEDPFFVFMAVGVPLIGILFSDVIKHIPEGIKPRDLFKLIKSTLLEVYEIPVGLLANTLSYARIFALALVHAGLFIALFSIAEIFTMMGSIGVILETLTIIIGTFVLVALEGFIVFLHTLRLHYYEWFTKFYSASGIEYMPYKIRRLYTYVKSKS